MLSTSKRINKLVNYYFTNIDFYFYCQHYRDKNIIFNIESFIDLQLSVLEFESFLCGLEFLPIQKHMYLKFYHAGYSVQMFTANMTIHK